tara:strand:- start:3278 stop:4255 length:978 start_codon:yes stop_codon:yes gene_type:complete
MSNYEDFFKDDPWSEITEPSYPEGRQLYMNDDRFWVSRNQEGQIQFFIHEKEIIEVKSIENLAGIEINIHAFNNRSSRLICTLISEELDEKDKFTIVAKDVSHYCSKYSGPELFLKVQERIKSWANFLKPTRTGLSHSEFVGFWGELYTISKLFMKWHLPSDVIRFWIGPEGKKQDITLNSIAVEVKTTISGDPRTIKISSVEQLECVTKSLYLMHIVANPSDSESGVSLEILFQECLEALSHDMNAETLFLQKTSKLYGKASESQLSDLFSILSISLFDVNEDFPFITRNEIKEGISAVQYEVLISALKEFEVTKSIEEIIKNG